MMSPMKKLVLILASTNPRRMQMKQLFVVVIFGTGFQCIELHKCERGGNLRGFWFNSKAVGRFYLHLHRR